MDSPGDMKMGHHTRTAAGLSHRLSIALLRIFGSGMLLLAAGSAGLPLSLAAEPKPRLVVMTDIGGDPDDEQSLFEDNRSENLTFFLEGRLVERNYASGGAGHWRRLGPWITRVTDGTLDLTSQGGAATLAGLELWSLIKPAKAGREK